VTVYSSYAGNLSELGVKQVRQFSIIVVAILLVDLVTIDDQMLL